MASSLSYGSDDTILEDTVKEAVSSLTDGQVYGSVIETEEYYYIVRLDQAFDAEATETEKESIISQRESENYDAKLQEWVDASAVDTKSGWDNLRVTDKDLYVVKAEDTSGGGRGSGQQFRFRKLRGNRQQFRLRQLRNGRKQQRCGVKDEERSIRGNGRRQSPVSGRSHGLQPN